MALEADRAIVSGWSATRKLSEWGVAVRSACRRGGPQGFLFSQHRDFQSYVPKLTTRPFENRLLKTVSDHRCEITGVKFRTDLLNH
jgi:hypothetical protein